MNLHIRRVIEPGNLQKERVVLYAQASLDVGRFLIVKSDFVDESSVSGAIKDSFWLPDLQVDAGELVVIYTKAGVANSRPNPDGSKTHFVYRNLKAPIWADQQDCAVLFQISDWEFKRVAASSKLETVDQNMAVSSSASVKQTV